jgi:hypothetical protein
MFPMVKNQHQHTALAIVFCMSLGLLSSRVEAQSAAPVQTIVTNHASGPFDVKTTPQVDKDAEAGLGRVTLAKQYQGELEGTGKGQMLTAGSAKGSGAYVAIERVTGTLKGRTGSFVLQHSGTMTKGIPQLLITIVPDSGTDQLAGIAGKMTIQIGPGGKHSYDLEYTLPNSN